MYTYINSSNLFKRSFSENDFNSLSIKNIYSYLFNRLKPQLIHPKTRKTRKVAGLFTLSDKFNLKFFQPYVLYPEFHAWFLTTTPIAILCIDTSKFSNFKKVQDFFELINLEIDIMNSSGFSLVLCLQLDDSCFVSKNEKENELIINNLKFFAKTHSFFETHLDIYNCTSKYQSFFKEDFLKKVFGYFYIYSSFEQVKSVNLDLENINPGLFNISFSVEPKEALKPVNFINIQSFIYSESYKDGNDLISVLLSNIPLYDDANEVIFSPSEVSGLA